MPITFNKNNFSFTDKLNEFVRNPEWKSGYSELISSGFVLPQVSGKTNFQELPGNSALWYTLSACFEQEGNKIYEKIYQFINQIQNIETANFNSLNSIAKELDLNNINFNYNYPIEIENLINIFSISQNLLMNDKKLLTNISSNDLILSSSVSNSAAMQGYDITDIYSSTNLSGTWSTNQINYINTISGNYTYTDFDSYLTFIDTQLSAEILKNLNIDNGKILNDFRTISVSGQNIIDLILDDREEIQSLKIQLDIDRFFHTNAEINKIFKGINKLTDYKFTEQELINSELKFREQETFYDTKFQKFLFDKKQKVKEYIAFIEDINLYDSTYYSDNNSNNYTLSGNYIPFFGFTNGVENSVNLINNTVKILRNICLKIFYQREELKKIWYKNSLIGTSQIFSTLIGEYIAKYFSDPSYWGYNSVTQLSGIDISQLPITNTLSGNLIGDIKVVEYSDSTEYFNIQNPYSDNIPYDKSLNKRYWEGTEGFTNKLISDFTSANVNTFYNEIGLDNLTFQEQEELTNTIFNIGAVSATQQPSWLNQNLNKSFDFINERMNGTFGTYGIYDISKISTDLYKLKLSGDVIPNYDTIQNTYTNQWLASPLLQNLTVDTFKTEWLNDPNIENWMNKITIDTSIGDTEVTVISDLFTNLDQVSNWISNDYSNQTFGYVSNLNTPIWRQSPLLSLISEEEFKTSWSLAPIKDKWVDFDSVTGIVNGLATQEPFRSMNWINNPQLIDYTISKGHTEVSGLTLSEWVSSDFIKGWNESPFDNKVVDINYDQNSSWVYLSGTNPFIQDWTNEPFSTVISNLSEIEKEVVGTLSYVLDFLQTSGIIEPLNGLDLNGSTSGMNLKYLSSPSGDFIEGNHKNLIHPSQALQPFIWNLSKTIFDNVLFENIYSPLIVSDYTNIKNLIDSEGRTINSWRYDAIDFSAYQTYYEADINFNTNEDIDYNINIDGPWNPKALEIYISVGPSGIINSFDTWYNNKYFDSITKNNEINKLNLYNSAILGLKNKFIYQYATDKFRNHYMLYKTDNEFETPGEIWMRENNSPLCFPLSANINSSITPDFNSSIFECNDFDIINLKGNDIFWSYTNSLTSDFVHTSILKFNKSRELITTKIPVYLKTSWTFDSNKRFIGIYNSDKDFILVSLKNINSLAGQSFLNKNTTDYDGTLIFEKYSINGDFSQENINFKTKYNEYFDQINPHFHWKLTNSDTLFSVGFESNSPHDLITPPSGQWFLTSDLNNNQIYDTSRNETSGKIYDNSITILDGRISIENNNIPVDLNPSYYWKYTDLTYRGINADDGLSGRTIFNYDIQTNDSLRMQFFGNIGTGALFSISNIQTFYCFDDLGIFKIRTYNPPFSQWNTLSGSYLTTFANEYVFNNSGDTATFSVYNSEFTTFNTYNITYNGIGCHLFAIERIEEPVYKYVSEQSPLSAFTWDPSGTYYHGLNKI